MDSCKWVVLLVCVAMAAGPYPGWAQESPKSTTYEACSEDTAARIRFIEQRLEDGRTHAKYWWLGWLGFYGIGTVFSSAQAATDNDAGKRADHIVSAVKALGGTVRQAFYFIPVAKNGADPMFAIPATTEENCKRRLETGEDLLVRSARQSQRRYSLSRHLFTIGVNLAGGLIVAEGFDQPSDGWTSAVVGIAIGEIMTFTFPWRGTSDLADYEREFAPVRMPESPKVSVGLVPTIGGVGFQVGF